MTTTGGPTYSCILRRSCRPVDDRNLSRVGAAGMIVRHVSDAGGDAGYAVKRLVRGMCSSRESARQGFASCLAQVLATLPEDEVSGAVVTERVSSRCCVQLPASAVPCHFSWITPVLLQRSLCRFACVD